MHVCPRLPLCQDGLDLLIFCLRVEPGRLHAPPYVPASLPLFGFPLAN